MVTKVNVKPNHDMKLAEVLLKMSGREVDIIYKTLHEYVSTKLQYFDMTNPEEKLRAEDTKKLYEEWENNILSSLTYG